MLSNSWPQLEEHDADLFEGFDKKYFSHRIGLRKPDRRAFEYVLKDFGELPEPIAPNEVILIDDQEKNMVRDMGFRPVLYTTPEQLVVDLNELGLPVAL